MSRFDAVGMFWQDVPVARTRGAAALRPMPPIPETGWRPPTYFPNLSAAKAISFDCETYDPELDDHGPGWARGKGHMVGFSVGTPEGYRWYFPIRHEVEPEYNLNPEHALAWLRDTLASTDRWIVGANLLYDVGWAAQEGISVNGKLIDVQFAEALIDERAPVALEELAVKYLHDHKKGSLLYQWCADYYGGKPNGDQRKNIYRAPPRLVGPYGEGDADLPLRIFPEQLQRLHAEGLMDLFTMECDLIPLLIAIRYAGVTVDIAKAEQVRDALQEREQVEQRRLNDLVGFEVRVNAAETVARAFDKFGIPYGRTPPTPKVPLGKPSFTKDFLKRVDHPLARAIEEIRRVNKLRRTFLESYILKGNVNGKVYCSFHPLKGDEGGTAVGRFSSSHPNLQNIPVRDAKCQHGMVGWTKKNKDDPHRCTVPNCPPLGKLIRSIFIPDPGHRQWRKYDYSQIQYREMVAYAVGPGAEEARQRYRDNPRTDYHGMVHKMVEEITHETWDRRPIKNLNFGLSFGMGAEKAGQSTGLKGDKLKSFLEAYHKAAPFIKKTMEHMMNLAETNGFIRTVLGRRARFTLWEPKEWGRGKERRPGLPYDLAIREYGNVRRAYLHKSLAFFLQGCEGDILKASMLRCWKEGVYSVTGVPRLLVHDETDFSDPGGQDEAFEYMHRLMETTVPLSIPILMECGTGPNWGSAD